MHKRLTRRALCATGVVAILGIASLAEAAEKPKHTVVTVGEMCGGCVKKITAHFKDAKGVARLRCDIKTKTVTLVPEPDVVFSPRDLWEAFEEIGKPPKKLAGPSGVFTKKPKE